MYQVPHVKVGWSEDEVLPKLVWLISFKAKTGKLAFIYLMVIALEFSRIN